MRPPAWLVGCVLACGAQPSVSGGESTSEAIATGSSGVATTEVAAPTGEAAEASATPTSEPAPETTSESGEATDEPGTESTTDAPVESDPWVERRGVMHVHTPFSNDACDGEGPIDGAPDPACLADLRAALCASGLEFALLTDDPARMQEHPFDRALLYSRGDGDSLVMTPDAALSNRMRCADGRTVLLAAGYESTHTLPLGLHHHVDARLYAGLTDELPLAEARALVEGLRAGGAVVAAAHGEAAELSAARVVAVGFDAMEWYNPRDEFKAALGGEVTGDPARLLGLLPFMAGSHSGAHPDLVYLRLLPAWPVDGFKKWREVQRARAVTGILGSDVHPNVAVAPVCSEADPALQAACVAAAAAALPEALAGLVTGGSLELSDGQRLDGLARVLRWLENRVLTGPGELGLAQLQSALRAGRSYGLFSVFGEPQGHRFAGVGPDETLLWIGDAASGPVKLELRLPERPVAGAGAPFTAEQADSAELRAELWRTDAGGSVKVDELTGAGATLERTAAAPGAYHVELFIRPLHLRAALGSEAALADAEYLWLITNPIRVLP